MDQRQRTGLPESSSVDAPGTPPAGLTPQILRALLPNLDRPHRLDAGDSNAPEGPREVSVEGHSHRRRSCCGEPNQGQDRCAGGA